MTTTAPDPAEARACAEAFVGHLQAGEAAAAEALTLPMPDDGFRFNPDNLPPGATVEIGEPQVEAGAVIVPCTFTADGESQSFPAVCLATPDGVRIDGMRSIALAMGGDPREILDSLTQGMEAMAEGMAAAMGAAMGAVADGLQAAFGEPPVESLLDDEHVVDDEDEQVARLEAHAVPAACARMEAALGHPVRVDVDWAGTGDAAEALLLGSTALGAVVGAIEQLAADGDRRDAVVAGVERVMIEWDDDQEFPAASARNGTLSVTVGPYMKEYPTPAIVMAEVLTEPLGLE